MARKSFVLLVVGTVVFFICSISSADVPSMINYQGKLTTSVGALVNDTVQMTFSIYPDTTGSSADWTETQAQVMIKDGIFNVFLGSVDSIPISVFDGGIKYLGVKVGSDPEMRPLKPMVSVPYAYRAGTAGGGGGGGWVDDGTVVRLADSTDYVGIGTTNPTEKLDVNGDIKVKNIRMSNSVISDDNSIHVIVDADNNSNSEIFSIRNDGVTEGTSTELFRIQENGHVGIGITTPLARLDVRTSAESGNEYAGLFQSTLYTDGNARGVAGIASVGTNGTAIGVYGQASGGESAWAGYFQGHVHVTGNVGIGTTDLGYKLHVEGKAISGVNSIASGDYATVSGGKFNKARGEYSVVCGGGGPTEADSNSASGLHSFIGGGDRNTAMGSASTISGGGGNSAITLATTVGGGSGNEAREEYSTVGGGWHDTAYAQYSTVGGGSTNRAHDVGGTIGGGIANYTSGATTNTIGGGYRNTAIGTYSSTVGGGSFNTASGDYSTVGGGEVDTASGRYSTVPGGAHNIAGGDYSFVAGRRAKANHDGAFVWGDATDADFVSTAANQFLIRASGGVGIGTANPQANLHINGTMLMGGVATIETGQRIQAEENGGARILGEQGNTPSTPAIGFFSTDGVNDGAGGNGIYRPAPNAMAFATSSEERMRITAGGKVGIGTTSPQGALDVNSTTGAFIVPRMTTAQRDALTAVNGMIIYNTTTNQFNFYENGAWVTK